MKLEDAVPVTYKPIDVIDARLDAEEQRRFNEQADWLATSRDPKEVVVEGNLCHYILGRRFLGMDIPRIGDNGGADRRPDIVPTHGPTLEVKAHCFQNADHLRRVSEKWNYGGNGWVPKEASAEYVVWVRYYWDDFKDHNFTAWIDGCIPTKLAWLYPPNGKERGASRTKAPQVPFEDWGYIGAVFPAETVQALAIAAKYD